MSIGNCYIAPCVCVCVYRCCSCASLCSVSLFTSYIELVWLRVCDQSVFLYTVWSQSCSHVLPDYDGLICTVYLKLWRFKPAIVSKECKYSYIYAVLCLENHKWWLLRVSNIIFFRDSWCMSGVTDIRILDVSMELYRRKWPHRHVL